MGVIEKQSIQDIADAIRDRNGLTTLYKPRQMDEAIRGLYKTEAVNHVFDNLTVSTTKEGTGFTLDDAEESGAVTELKGNTTQEGTPTPSSPVEVETVSGDNNVVVGNKNLFDKSTIVAGDIRGQNTSIRLSSRQALWLDTGTYTMSTNAVSPFRYACSVQNVGVPPLSRYPTYILDSGWKTGNTSYTFTLTTAGYFVLALSKTSGDITVEEVADFEYQLEKGNQATTYIAHQGNTYRVDLGGKNKFNVEQAISRMENNAGTLVNDWGTYEDGILTMNRSMGYHGTTCFAGQKFNLEANKTYTLSAIVYLTGTNATSNVILGFAGESNPNVTITKETWTKVSRTVTYTEYKENMRAFIQPSNTGNVLQIKEIMFCEGTDTEYSPYTANPIELCKIGNYVDKLKRAEGENLFNKDDVENDKRLDSSGQATGGSATGFSLTNYIEVEPNTTYTYSRNTTSSSYYVNISEYTSDKTHIQRLYSAGNTTTTYTFTTPNNCYYLRINDATTNLYSIMLNEGSTALPYEPYGNNWYIEKNIGKVVLNGTETWKITRVSASNSNAFWNQYVNLNIPVGKYGQKYCDRFEYQESTWSQSTPNHLAENTNYINDLSILFNVDNTIATTLAEWTTWLTNNNTTVYYILATPTYTEITDTYLLEQLQALDNIELYEDLCYVDWIGIEKPTMNLRYYVDTDKILERLREE